MTQNTLEAAARLVAGYGHRRPSRDVLDVWAQEFADVPDGVFLDAVRAASRSSDFAPRVPEIRARVVAAGHKASAVEAEVWERFDEWLEAFADLCSKPAAAGHVARFREMGVIGADGIDLDVAQRFFNRFVRGEARAALILPTRVTMRLVGRAHHDAATPRGVAVAT